MPRWLIETKNTYYTTYEVYVDEDEGIEDAERRYYAGEADEIDQHIGMGEEIMDVWQDD